MWGLLQHHTHGLKSIYMALLAHGPPFCHPRSEPSASPRSAHDGPPPDRAAVLIAARRVDIQSSRDDLRTWRGWRAAPAKGLEDELRAIGDTLRDSARGRARAWARGWAKREWGVMQGSRGVARTGGGVIARAGGAVRIYAGSTAVISLISPCSRGRRACRRRS